MVKKKEDFGPPFLFFRMAAPEINIADPVIIIPGKFGKSI
jgi:hypothetical protein